MKNILPLLAMNKAPASDDNGTENIRPADPAAILAVGHRLESF